MKKLFLPIICDKESKVDTSNGVTFFPIEAYQAYFLKEEAIEKAKQLALTSPKAKVIIFEASVVIEPRRIEFAEKSYNEKGELVI